MVYAMHTEAIRSDWVGLIIDGKYPLLQWLGGTQESAVFLTELPESSSQRATIKLISADIADAQERLTGWTAAAALSHPHLMRVHHAGRCQIGALPMLYVVTEYADEILAQILTQRPLTPAEAGEMLGPLLDALRYLHGNGFVHGHLKPSNIMAVGEGLKLSSDHLLASGAIGKLDPAAGIYNAPEGAAGTITPAADLWSLGVTLVEVLTQQPPRWEASAQQDPETPKSIPLSFAGLVRRCLRSDAERRCTLDEVQALLPTHVFSGAAIRSKRGMIAKLLWAALAVTLLALVAVAIVWQMRSRVAAPSQPLLVSTPAAVAPSASAPSPASVTEISQGAAHEVMGNESAVVKSPPKRNAVVKGAVATRILPEILDSAQESIRGSVQVSLRVTVAVDGTVAAAALDSPQSSKYFVQQALKAVRGWKFKPARVDDQTVSSVWRLRFVFTASGTEVTPVEVSP
jgi:TonB family protein